MMGLTAAESQVVVGRESASGAGWAKLLLRTHDGPCCSTSTRPSVSHGAL